MPEKHLLLSPAKSGILVEGPRARYLRFFFLIVGLLMVLVGAADITTRASIDLFGQRASMLAFAPAAAIGTLASVSDPLINQPFVASTTPLTPALLKIPAIGVSAHVEAVGQKADSSMATPSKFGDVAWYELGSQPGAPGNAVFAGHVNNALTRSGVFEHLSDLQEGDYVTVEDASGHALMYRVTEVNDYSPDDAPVASIFATSGPSQLVLITCEGDWVPSAKSYSERLVVVARLIN